MVKELYDYTKDNESQNYKNTLPELLIKNFDEEQIWQELELQNSCCTTYNIETVSELSVKKDKLCFPLSLKCLNSGEEESKIGLNDGSEELDNIEDHSNESENEDYDLLDEDDGSFDDEASNVSNDSLSESDSGKKQKKGK